MKNIKIIFIFLIFFYMIYFYFSEKKIIHFLKGTFNFLHPHVYNSVILLIDSNHYSKEYLIHPLLGIENNYWIKTIFEKKYKVDYSYLIYDLKNLKNIKKNVVIFDPIYKINCQNKKEIYLIKNYLIYPKRDCF